MPLEIAPGQLANGESVYSGVETEEKADREAQVATNLGRNVVDVRLLVTTEGQNRWCVILKD